LIGGGGNVTALTYGRLRSMIGNPSGDLYYPDGVDLTFEANKATISTGGSLSAKIKALDLALKKVIFNVSETVVGLGQYGQTPTLNPSPIVWNQNDLNDLSSSVDLSDPFLEPADRGTSLWSYVGGIKRKLDQIDPNYNTLARIIGPESYPLAAKFSEGDYQRNVFGYLGYLNEETNPLSIRDVSYDLPTTDWTSGGATPELLLEIPTAIQDNYSENAGVALRIILKLTLVSQVPSTATFDYYRISISQNNVTQFINTMNSVASTKELIYNVRDFDKNDVYKLFIVPSDSDSFSSYRFMINVTWQFVTTLDPLSFPKELSIDPYGFIENVAEPSTYKIVPLSSDISDSSRDILYGGKIVFPLDENERAIWFKRPVKNFKRSVRFDIDYNFVTTSLQGTMPNTNNPWPTLAIFPMKVLGPEGTVLKTFYWVDALKTYGGVRSTGAERLSTILLDDLDEHSSTVEIDIACYCWRIKFPGDDYVF